MGVSEARGEGCFFLVVKCRCIREVMWLLEVSCERHVYQCFSLVFFVSVIKMGKFFTLVSLARLICHDRI